ncbi:restriction endonuclease [Salmonella enterica]|nr:restriction endonuclease [Salmonella enterica]EKY5338485.1 restriction endonuclease [Salmonella enterica]EKY5343303.1 restriction endonuclease [Salmonella enterica]ELD8774025.1 restriction endonuclease [Salmonella enterica]
MSKNLMIGLALLSMFFIYALCFRKKNNHDRKRLSAEKIIDVINSIDLPAQKIAYLRKVDPYAFEELIMTLLQRKGFVIGRNKRYSGDGGLDGRFEHNRQLWLIQAKRYSNRIKQEHVSAFASLLKENNCSGGIFVHTGKTPASVREYVKACPSPQIEIISGDRLLNLFDSTVKLKF